VYKESLKKAKKTGLNVSEICREALLQATDMKAFKKHKAVIDKFKDIPNTMLKTLDKIVGREPSYAKKWANIINKKCGTKLTKRDILDYIARK